MDQPDKGIQPFSTNTALAETSQSLNQYITAATSDNTRKAYRQDVRHFISWGGLLPTTPDMLIRYLHAHAGCLNPRTLARRLTAIKNWHCYQGFNDPTSHPLVKKTLTGIQHVHGQPKEKARAFTIEQITLITAHLQQQTTLVSLRNIALIQIGFFGAFRRSELVNIQMEHIQFLPEGIEIMIPRSKTDPTGEGLICAIPYGDKSLCPVTALNTWCENAGITSGYVFRAINRFDCMSSKPLSTQSVNSIIKSITRDCNIPDPDHFSSHSLRRGFATAASKKGASLMTIMRHGRWRHEGTVLGYIEEGNRFEENAVKIILNNEQG